VQHGLCRMTHQYANQAAFRKDRSETYLCDRHSVVRRCSSSEFCTYVSKGIMSIGTGVPSRITRDFGPPSRKILAHCSNKVSIAIRDKAKSTHFIQFHLESRAIGEHVVIRPHTSLYLVNRRDTVRCEDSAKNQER
jgi:hypothetical protein